MKNRFRKPALLLLAWCGFASRVIAINPDEWRHTQSLDVDAAGLAQISLPAETLDAARPALEDLRLIDSSGKEVPYLIERRLPRAGAVLRGMDFHAEIAGDDTTITLRVDTTAQLNGVILETPATGFVKAARVEGSHDGKNWQELATGQPLFRFPRGAENLEVSFPSGAWEFLRVTVADDRSQPVPFTGAQVRTLGIVAPSAIVDASIKSRNESPGATRIALDLGAANLPLASLDIETPEPLFTRNVTLAVPEMTGQGIQEKAIGSAVIYRVDAGGKNEEHLQIPVEKTIRSRELVLIVQNNDNPPLAISAVHASRRLTQLVFFAPAPGRYTLLTGNSQCPAPHYDLQELSGKLDVVLAVGAKLSPLADTPGYKAPEALAALPLSGVGIDLTGWKYRKSVQLPGPGLQQLELDLEVLAHATPEQSDLRLVSDGKQLPFLFERPSISRDIALNATAIVDPKRPTLSKWSLKLPQPGLPVTRLVCAATSPLFQRDMRLWEELPGGNGEKIARELGHATWQQTPDHATKEFVITLDEPPLGDTLFLETDNGDNPSIELRDFRCYHPLTRILFKATPDPSKPLWLYYGNPEATPPRYDLSLIAADLPTAEKQTAIAGAEEPLKPSTPAPSSEEPATPGGIIFWAALGLVVIALLAVISRLLPKNTQNQ